MQKAAITLWGMLLTVGFLWPSEGAETGEGLHFAVLWMLAGAGTAWTMSSRQTGSRLISLSTTAVLLLGLGYVLSTLGVFQFGGDRRTSVNLTFHFLSAAAGWMVVQRLCAAGRQMLVVQLLVGLGVGVAVLGIVDYHYLLPKERDWFVNATDQERLQYGIPRSGPERISYENRLLHSLEPQGPFALTNTLGGVLAVMVVFLAGTLLSPQESDFPRRSVILFLLLTGYCLLLTKSRTAWVATAIGVILQTFLLRAGPNGSRSKLLLWMGGAGGLAGVVFMAALASGALDQEVILEAPRSLQFRLFYWKGATDVILDNPLLGTGPGNFRNAYLMYRLAESSEAIFDPHNIVLDAWISAGLLGLSGLVLLMGTAVGSLRQKEEEDSATAALPMRPECGLRTLLFGGGIGFAAWEFVFGNPLTGGQVPAVGWVGELNGAWMIPLVALPVAHVMAAARVPRSTPAVCLLALFIHLLGAGGLQILVVVQLLVALHALSIPWQKADGHVVGRWQAGGAVVTAGLIMWMAIRPNLDSGTEMAMASRLLSRGEPRQAAKALERACESDPWSLNSAQRRAELLTYMFEDRFGDAGARESVPVGLEREFTNTMEAVNVLVEMDPRRYTGFLFRSRVQQVCARLTNDSAITQSATRDLKSAVDRYPTDAHLLAELAEHLRDAGPVEEARLAARRALEQDRLNHDWGHSDRYLPESLVDRLKDLSGPAQE